MSRDESRTPHSESQRLYADVIVPRHIAKSFTYLVPVPLAPNIAVGRRVLIPFGRTTLEGAVVALRTHLPPGIHVANLKEIRSLADTKSDLSPALFELSRRVADEYLAPWGQCLRLILPPGRSSTESSPRYVATEQGRTALSTETCPELLRPLLTRIARRSSGVLASTLVPTRGSKARQNLNSLEANGWIATTAQSHPAAGSSTQTARTSSRHEGDSPLPFLTHPPPALPTADAERTGRVDKSLCANVADRMLVHAPWESRIGLLVHAVQQAHAMKKSALIIVGEVARAEWLARLLAGVTKFPMSLIHGSLDDTSWRNSWEQVQNGTSTIVVGTRSVVFAPLRSLGLIWIDREEDPALKEPQEPRYHARDVAWMRAQTERALLVLGSSHPSLESYLSAGPAALRVPDESSSRPLIDVVDLRRESSGTVFSASLLAAMRETLARKDRVLLFLNRKGFAGALVCRDCGWVPRCPFCAVALHYSRQATSLTCRYCGAPTRPPDACPTCGAARIVPVGEGTERIESEATRLFPHARTMRLDGDTLRRPAAARLLWDQAASGAWDMLIGTQALFQREPLPPVGLVGIVQADSGLNIPDFRAAERTYHVLGDAIGLARPAAEGGHVIIQTLLPAHHAIQSLIDWNPARFYEEELAARRLLGYPPVVHLVSLSVSGKDPSAVEQAARQLARHLEEAAAGHGATFPAKTSGRSCHPSTAPLMAAHDRITILGPVPAAGGRPRGYHRRQIMVKGQDRTPLHEIVRLSVKTVESSNSRRRVKVTIDVDPIEMG